MKKKDIIIYIILVILLISNLNLIRNSNRDSESNNQLNSYLNYTIVLRIDRQCDIYDNYVGYLEKIKDNNSGIEEFNAYVKGIKMFAQQDILNGIYNSQLENNSELNKLMRELYFTLDLDFDIMKHMDNEDIDKMINIYNELIELLNRNNKEASLTYYIFRGDINNKNLKKIISEVNSKIQELKDIKDTC